MISMKTGEKREVGFRFWSADVFTIASATYDLKNSNNVIVDTGIGQISDTKITALLNAPTVGTYQLIFTVNIGTEIYKPVLDIIVT